MGGTIFSGCFCALVQDWNPAHLRNTSVVATDAEKTAAIFPEISSATETVVQSQVHAIHGQCSETH